MTAIQYISALPIASLLEFLTGQRDYLLFAFVCIALLSIITVWLKRSGRSRDNATVGIGWFVVLAVLAAGWFLVHAEGEEERERLRKRIEGLAPTYANELALMGHASITVDTPADDPLYLEMIEKQIQWLDLNRSVADIYTFRKHPESSEGNQLIEHRRRR